MDFVAARLLDGRWFRVLTVVDQFTRECLLLLADSSLTGQKVALALSQVVAERGAPVSIAVDNGGEFVSRAMEAWAYQYRVDLDFIRPGRPVENGYIESLPSLVLVLRGRSLRDGLYLKSRVSWGHATVQEIQCAAYFWCIFPHLELRCDLPVCEQEMTKAAQRDIYRVII